ncbi:MAG: ATP-binding cassette domain-containing protein [Rhodovibrionaceae bacterium]
MPPLLTLDSIQLSFGGEPLLEGAEFSLGAGERLCLVGRNGSGKSTLLKIAAGLIEADGGKRFLQPGTTLRYLPQEPDLSGHATTLAFAEAGLGPADDSHRARYLLQRLGLTGEEAPATLSGGEKRRAALARALAPQPDILLLDEPTNHLDLPAIEWLEHELKSLRAAMILISHDRRFLERLSQAVVWLERGRTRRLDQGFAAFESWRDQIAEQETTERHKLDRRIAAETQWLHKGVTARRKRNMGRLRALQELRRQRREQRQTAGTVQMAATEGKTSGKLVIEAKEVTKAYAGAPVVKDFSARILRGDRIGIIGPNGAGKTTLLNLLTGALAPDGGRVRLGAKLEIATVDQARESLDPETSLQDALTGGGGDSVMVGGEQRHVIGYMKDFLFLPEQARTAISALSGGERGRLMLARALARPANLLVLDEPTNDLDLETLDLLQELLADYPGTVLLVSHDRDFLDRVVTSVINAEGGGRWIEYAGGYADMVAQRGADMLERPRVEPSGAERSKPAGSGKSGKPKAPPKRGKLSFKDKHALETLPGRIAALETQIAALQRKLSDPELFSRDAKAFETATRELEQVSAALERAEEDWLRLEMLREEVEGG